MIETAVRIPQENISFKAHSPFRQYIGAEQIQRNITIKVFVNDNYENNPVVVSKSRISAKDAITQARDEYVEKSRNNIIDTSKSYPLEHDAVAYKAILRNKHAADYKDAWESLNFDTKMMLESHIGERLNVCISSFNFRIKNEQLLTEKTGESMLKLMKRGRDHRKNHGKPVDFPRESAEVTGFGQIQKVLADDKTPEGTMMLSISPQGDIRNGSIYKHNFYDVYQKTKDGVISYRFTSGLTPKESQDRIRQFDERYSGKEVPKDFEFLSQPVKLDEANSPFKTPLDVNEHLKKKHSHMSKEEFDRTIELCTPLITSYINTLCENPNDLLKQEKMFNALLNYADIAAGKVENTVLFQRSSAMDIPTRKGEDRFVRPWIPTAQQINILSEQPVRQVDTGCGLSGGSVTSGSTSSAYSVAEFSSKSIYGSDRYGRRDFACKACGETNIRPVNGLLSNCQHCGSDEVAC